MKVLPDSMSSGFAHGCCLTESLWGGERERSPVFLLLIRARTSSSNSSYLSNTMTLGIRASTHESEGDTSIQCRGMYKSKDVRTIIREWERVRKSERKDQGIGRPLVVLESRVHVHAAGEVSTKALSAMLKLDFIMNVMGSHWRISVRSDMIRFTFKMIPVTSVCRIYWSKAWLETERPVGGLWQWSRWGMMKWGWQ